LVVLLAARLYELLTLVACVALALPLSGIGMPEWSYVTLLIVGGLGLFLVIRLDVLLKLASAIVSRMLAWPFLARRKLPQRLAEVTRRLGDNLAALRRPRLVIETMLSTLGIWAGIFACFYWLLRGFGAPMTLAQVVTGGSVTGLSGLLPVNTVGNFGTLEAGWTAGFVAVGLQPSMAVASGLAMHVIVLAISIALAVPHGMRLGVRTWDAFISWRRGR
jgi:uncharacterized membrane protein YbhN (UPF0104 family)